MAKEKFQLTSDLVKIEPEPEQKNTLSSNYRSKKTSTDDREKITINIDKNLKLQVQMYALKNRSNMTDIIHEALREKLGIKD